jgi:hypothetical protein
VFYKVLAKTGRNFNIEQKKKNWYNSLWNMYQASIIKMPKFFEKRGRILVVPIEK